VSRRWGYRGLWLLASILLIAAVGSAAGLITQGTAPCQQLVVPAYFYPGPSWTRAVNSRPVPSMMILDITSSGAGSSPDPNYQRTIRRARAAGIRIMGYSNTGYGRRPAAAVELDVRKYKAWYGVTDMFLDAVSSGGGALPYYRRLAGYIHRVNPGSTVMLNPGTYPDQRYMSVGDVVLVYEDTYANYLGLRVPRWAGRYPAARFAQIIYATPESRFPAAIGLSRRRHAGYVYVTGNAGLNPYRALPGYWPRENRIIAAQCSVSRAGYRPG
jgi:hypothetical protein